MSATEPLRSTRKLYYEDALRAAADARVVLVADGKIELDRTVAFAEGGGQEGDHGIIRTSTGRELRFVDTQKRLGHPLMLKDFPVVNVNCIVDHIVNPDDANMLEDLTIGEVVRVEIDVVRRASLTLSHTASHLVYMAAEQVRPDAVKYTKGCHIKTDSARFDFATSERFTHEQVAEIARRASVLAEADHTIRLYAHPDEPEAIYWECAGEVIPCGGTHLDRTGPVGQILLRRKSLGRGLERLTLTFPDGRIDVSSYHG